MIQYNETILQQTADQLYARADNLVRNYTAAGALAGVALASIVILFGDWRPYALLFAIIGSAYGRFQANKFAYELRFQAQMLLCQLQIERNTRPK